MDPKDDLTFSPAVAETLGIECALILKLYQTNKLENTSSLESIKKSIKNILVFVNEDTINKSVEKLLKFELIKLDEHTKKIDYQLSQPKRNFESKRMFNEWAPNKEAAEIINMSEIDEGFCNLKLKEFKVYWIERGQRKNNWNSTFIDYLRREWAKELNSNIESPQTIDENWYPDDDVFDILNLSEITKDSALKYLREFILYWKEKGIALNTWNSKFIEHVKRRNLLNNDFSKDEENKKHIEPGKYSQDFKTRTNDNTWAKEINLD